MNDLLRQFRDFFVSLQLTVVLLALGIVLVFAATLDQTNLGVWGIQTKWFRSFIVLSRICQSCYAGLPVKIRGRLSDYRRNGSFCRALA